MALCLGVIANGTARPARVDGAINTNEPECKTQLSASGVLVEDAYLLLDHTITICSQRMSF